MSGLPSHWQKLTLAETCQIMAGYGFPEYLQGNPSGDLPFYKVGDISEAWKRGDVYLTKANHYISKQDARGIRAKPLPENTTVFAKIGAAIALNRRAILSVPSLVDNNVMGVHPSTESLDHKFLFHFICTVKLDELSRATTVPSVRKTDIEQIAITLPPISEQRQIVAEIEKQFTRLEAGMAALRRVQTNLKRYRAAVLKAACEGRLVPTEAELAKTGNRKTKFETGEALLARILSERRQNWQGRGKYKEPAAPDTAELGSVVEGWTWASVEQVADVALGKMLDKNKHKAGRKLPYLRNINVRWGSVDTDNVFEMFFEDTQIERFGLRAGDVLVCEGGEPGRAAVWDGRVPGMMYQKAIHRVRFFGTFNSRYFVFLLEFLAKTGRLERWFTGSTIKHFTRESFVSLPVPLPPLAEQTRIVAEVERRLSGVDELEAVMSANLQRATRLRQSILQKAFNGRLL